MASWLGITVEFIDRISSNPMVELIVETDAEEIMALVLVDIEEEVDEPTARLRYVPRKAAITMIGMKPITASPFFCIPTSLLLSRE